MGTSSGLWTSLIRWEASRPNPKGRIKTFRDRVPWLGPFIWILSILYFVGQVWVAQVWEPSYSWLHNTISDLGNTQCGPKFCSPRHEWMNWELFLLGLVMGDSVPYLFLGIRRTPSVGCTYWARRAPLASER